MYKLKEIEITDFKYIYGKEKIDIECKNLLLYGENGSGKSSIYWALYTFLQSVFKLDVIDIEKDENIVEKYFCNERVENLVNRFAINDLNSSVKLTFSSKDEIKKNYCISKNVVNTRSDNFIKELSEASDFLNYRILSSVYNFRNSEEIDLFDMFEREIMMFITFREDLVRHDGIEGKANAADWWTYISLGLNPKPKKASSKYKTFAIAVDRFNMEFELFLNDIIMRANEYLQHKFHNQYKLFIEYIPAVYDDFKKGSKTARTNKTSRPKILLRVESTRENLSYEHKKIDRVHTFFNEAKLTTLALSIRFAILDKKINNPDIPKLLVLDDLLVSLDMSNRDIVLNILLNEFSEYQMLMFTHDKAFYNLIKRRIDSEGETKKWVFKEMYQDEDRKTKIPKPFIFETKSNMDLAKKYYKNFDYPACGNYMRKECERLLIKLLPENKSKHIKDGEGSGILQLDNLITNFECYYESIGGDYTPFKKLKEYKDILLNPLSHDNISSPIYKTELDNVMNILETLSKIEKILIVNIYITPEKQIILKECDCQKKDWEYKIKLTENFSILKTLDDKWLYENPKCIVIDRKNITDDLDIEKYNFGEMKLNDLYNKIHYTLLIKGRKDANIEPKKDLKKIIEIDGKTLESILKSYEN